MIQVCFDFYLLHIFHWDLLKKRGAAKLWWSEPSYNLMLMCRSEALGTIHEQDAGRAGQEVSEVSQAPQSSA